MITVFTSTYNRAYRLGNLYASLKRQTSKAFEWIVINDGSTDGTEAYAMLEGEISKLCIKKAFLENADVVEQADKVVFRRLEYKIATKEEVKNSLQTIMRMMNTFYNRKDSRVAIKFRY